MVVVYNKLPDEIKYKIDINIKNTISNYVKKYVLKNLDKFHKNRFKKIIIDFYRKTFVPYNFYIGMDMILNDLFFWLNLPYSENMDTPFMLGRFSNNFINVMKRMYPNITQIIDNWQTIYYVESPHDDYRLETIFLNMLMLNPKYSTKYLVKNILDNLSITELEKFYIYIMKQIGKCKKKNIIDISINLHF